ncbi:MAG: DUF2905 domain-containing protein [Actinomycetes bacterium]|jgi:hypothetical protein|nr:MAG: DUF2905 domain-containing protein [Actinomycetota bacterium]
MRSGNLLMALGALLFVVGLLVRFAPGVLAWFGNLPGDIKIEGENTRVFIPITSMIIVSAILTAVANLVGYFLRDR